MHIIRIHREEKDFGAYTDSEGPDQTAHPRIPIRDFAV